MHMESVIQGLSDPVSGAVLVLTNASISTVRDAGKKYSCPLERQPSRFRAPRATLGLLQLLNNSM
jgi:hypothetical protein